MCSNSVKIKNSLELISKEVLGNSFWKIISHVKFNIYVIKRINEQGYYILKTRPYSCPLINNELAFYFKIDNIKPKYINILPLIDYNLDICINNINHINFVIPKKSCTLRECAVHKFVLNEFTTKILQAIRFIHSLGFGHFNLNPDNIVFDSVFEPYIIDFKYVSNYVKNQEDMINKKNIEITNNVHYQSLDIHFKIKSKRSDLVSLGFILYQQINYQKPLPWENEFDINKIIDMKIKFFENENNNYFYHPIILRYFQIVFSKNIFEDPDYFSLFSLFKF
jgi:serine/threonine protein kinase